MDPHSRLSQFNQRSPKVGPQPQYYKQMDPKTISNVFDQFKRGTGFAKSNSAKDLTAVSARPIASNARLRRDEKYMKDMYLAFVDNALTQKVKGVTEHYDDLVRQFDPKGVPVASNSGPQMRNYLTALSHVVSKLDRDYLSLVEAIVSMPWTTMDSSFVTSYISFIGMLVSARPEYLTLVLDKSAQSLTYHSGKLALSSGFAESSLSPVTRRTVYDRVHNLLQHLLELIPTLPSTLYPLLVRNFPHKRQTQVEHVTFIRNLLRLSEYCPEVWDRILSLIIERTIQIDVEIQVEIEDLEAETPADGDEVFQLDVFDTVIGQEGDESESDDDSDSDSDGALSDISSDAGSDSSKEDLRTSVKTVQDLVTKLDNILDVIFKHLNRLHESINRSSPPSSPKRTPPRDDTTPSRDRTPSPILLERRKAVSASHFQGLLTIFERIILRTFKSRYTQFLIFWYSSLDNQFRDEFLGTVISKALLEHEQPVVTRAAAASYIASYVSRAQFVDRVETRSVVRLLCDFLGSHLDVFDSYAHLSEHASTQSAEQHAVFYAVTQAVFLIFCFRWRDLQENIDAENDELSAAASGAPVHRSWLPQLNVMQRVINSPLNPLKICSSNVVQQFARVAQKVGFIYCFSIIEANKRAEYSGKDGSQTSGAHGRQLAFARQSFDADLTTFFPFDPFKLPRSCSFIEGIYREWTSVAIDDEDEEEEEEEIEEYEYQPEQDLYMHGPSSFVDDSTGALGESFGGMSISPVHSRVTYVHS